jgi:hypothetical protein
MNDRQKIVAIALGVGLFLFLALVAGFKLALTGSATSAPLPVAETPAASEPATTSAASESKALTRLIAVQAALQQASEALGKARVKNHGGFVEQGRASVRVALEDANAAIVYLAEHPEAGVSQPTTTDICKVRPVEIPSYDIKPDGSHVSPNLANALTALNEALAQMMQPPGSEHPISAPMDGARDKIIDDIDQTAQHVLSAYEFGERGAAPPPTLETAPATHAAATRP